MLIFKYFIFRLNILILFLLLFERFVIFNRHTLWLNIYLLNILTQVGGTFLKLIGVPRLSHKGTKTLKILFVRVIDKTWENCVHPLIWIAIAKLLSILQVRARFLEGRRMRGQERTSGQTSQRYRAAWISYMSHRDTYKMST